MVKFWSTSHSQPDHPVLSVIIATCGKPTYLDLTLASLACQILPQSTFEVLVVDDGSPEYQRPMLDRIYQEAGLPLKLFRNEKAQGRSAARNIALRQAKGEIIVFLDDDRIVEKDFLNLHLQHHILGPCTVIGPVNMYVQSHIRHDHPMLALAMGFLRGTTYPGQHALEIEQSVQSTLGEVRVLQKEDIQAGFSHLSSFCSARHELDHGRAFTAFANMKKSHPAPWLHWTTGNASVPRAAIEAVGLLDERYKGWGAEDMDLAYRLWKHGLPFTYEARVPTLHQQHDSSPASKREHRRNLQYFFRKYPEVPPKATLQVLNGQAPVMALAHLFAAKTSPPERDAPSGVPRANGSHSPDADRRRLLYLSRGMGLGHAQRDLEIARRLCILEPGLQVLFASYGDAVPALRESEFPVTDLSLPAAGANGARLITLHALMQQLKPDLLVSDEEMLAPPVARALGIPSVYVTNWLLHEEGIADCSYLTAAEAILYVDFEEHAPLPDWLSAPTFFVGPILPGKRPDPEAAAAIRRQLKLEPDAPLLVGACGGGHGVDERFFKTLIQAAEKMQPRPHLILLAGSMAGRLNEQTKRTDITILAAVKNPLDYFAAADLVVTRGGHSTLWELAWLGAPSISIPRPASFNPMNQAYANAMAARGATLHLNEQEITPEILAEQCRALLKGHARETMLEACRNLDLADGAEEAAKVILRCLPPVPTAFRQVAASDPQLVGRAV